MNNNKDEIKLTNDGEKYGFPKTPLPDIRLDGELYSIKEIKEDICKFIRGVQVNFSKW